MAGGVLGAALWAAVATVTGYEVGWIAWAVGGMVGWGVAWGNRGVTFSPKASGWLAVAITVLAIPCGKYLALHLTFPSDEELTELLLEDSWSEEFAVSLLADSVVQHRQMEGRLVDWPEGVDPSEAWSRSEYPPDVWSEAMTGWAERSEEGREELRNQAKSTQRANVTEFLPEIRAAIKQDVFLGSFGAMDLIFFGLALTTAFGLAAGKKKSANQIAGELAEAMRAAMFRVMLADGAAGDEEVEAIQEAHAGLTGARLSEEEVRSRIELARSGLPDLETLLPDLVPHLSQNGKAMILRSALGVAMADGEVSQEERDLIHRIAGGLGLSEEDLHDFLAGVARETRERVHEQDD